MTIASYSDLLTEMGNWLNRTDLSAEIPTFIQLFETRMNRRLRTPDQIATATQTIVSGQNIYPIPSGIREVKQVYLAGTPRVELSFMSFEDLRRFYPTDDSDIPQSYSIVGENIVLQPVPVSGTLTVIGYNTLAALGTGNTTNWLLTNHPDAYLFGSLCESAAYLKDDERLPIWKETWDEILSEINAEANARRIPSGPVASRAAVWE